MQTRRMILATLALGAVAQLRAQEGAARQDTTLPFAVGEKLVYHANLGKLRGRGRAVMRVEGPEDVRGRSTYRLRFDLEGRVVGLKVEDHTRSWLDMQAVAALRYTKREKSPLSTVTESVEVYPERGQWIGTADSGALSTEAPLDELSFMYFLRTLPLADGDEYTFERHYDQSRNPTRVRVVGRETIRVPAGEYATVLVEMYVKDRRRYDGEGVVRINLTDDDRRIPVRIASRMRGAGSTVLSLESVASSTTPSLASGIP
jgi:hypothetical protein